MLRFWSAPSAFVSVFISLLLASAECRGQAAATPETLSSLTLPANTPVKLRLKQPLYDKESQPGRSLMFEVVENVAVNGQVVIQKGTTVTGSVRQVDRTGEGPAKLLLDVGSVETITGQTVRLVWTGTTAGAARDRYKMKDAGGLVAADPEVIPVLPVFVAMTLFQGKKALLSEGTREMAYVGENVALDTARLQAAQASVAKPGHATVFFLPLAWEDAVAKEGNLEGFTRSILCGPVQLELRDPIAVRLRPGQYRCRVGSGDAATLEFADGTEYYVKEDFVESGTSKAWMLVNEDPMKSETFEAWNRQNDAHAWEHKIVDVTMPGHALDLAPYRKKVEKHPQSGDAHRSLASYLNTVGELDEALQEYRQALALEPNSRQAHFDIAKFYQKKGDCTHAIEEYRSGVQIKPKDESAREGFAYLLEDCKDLDAALAEAKEALRIWPDKAWWLHYLLGRLLVKKNDPDAAIIELQWAITKEKHFPIAECELGRAFELKGDLETALDHYRTASQADVRDEECRASYARLQQQLKK